MSDFGGLIGITMLLLFVGYVIFRARRKVFGDPFLGAPIDAKVGEALVAGGRFFSTRRVSVYRLRGGSDRAVGVQLGTGLPSEMQVVLSLKETQRLIDFLESATNAGAQAPNILPL